MELELRKFTKFVDKTFIEGGKKAKEPVLLVSVAAVFKNPWHGKGFVEDLKPIILDLAPKLGDILVPELIKEIYCLELLNMWLVKLKNYNQSLIYKIFKCGLIFQV